jgi:nitrate reductase delta subunit
MALPNASVSLRALALLLSYPDAALRGHLPALRAALRNEGMIPSGRLGELDALISRLENGDPLEIEAAYVQLFDRGRATSLHLFEHVHGDSRDRGPAMIDLQQTYEKAGLFLAPGELPDFLPVLLEFASTQPPRQAARPAGRDGTPLQRPLQRPAAARQRLRQRPRRATGTGRRERTRRHPRARRSA